MYSNIIDYLENNQTDFTNKLKNNILTNNIFNMTETLKVYQDKDNYRNLTFNRLNQIIESKIFDEINFNNDYEKYFAIFDHAHLIDGSLSIKLGVNFGLFGFSILKLGTNKHNKYIEELTKGNIYGCFAMTELAHGSNVKDIGTRADYDKASNSFTINTGELDNRKFWIGNAYINATHSVTFAQLYVNNNYEGIHAFIIPLRDSNKLLLKGITITDCGTKLGLNGVDNGMIQFNDIIIPYDNLLDSNCCIKEGIYNSSISTIDKRFSRTLAALTLGRVGLSSGSLQFVKKGLFVALNYALQRKQFNVGEKELEIINYHSIQDRLILNLSKFFVYTGVSNHMKNSLKNNEKDYIHKISSGFKPIISWFALDCLQKCREACGGYGFDILNEIGLMRNDVDIYTTFEGDNNILLQQLGKMLLSEYGKKYNNSKNQLKIIIEQNLIKKITDLNNFSAILRVIEYKFLNKILYIFKNFKKEYVKEKNFTILWNNHQREIIDMSKFYIDYLTFKISFDEIKKINNMRDKNLLNIMLKLTINKWIVDNKYYLVLKNLMNKKIFSDLEIKNEIYYKIIKNNLEYILSNFNIPKNLLSSYLINFNKFTISKM